jgi:outer membrane lipoprotein-sorting protein
MIKKWLILLVISINFVAASAQSSLDSTGKNLQKIAAGIQNDTVISNRFKQDSIFTRSLIQYLKQPNSFNNNLDSLVAIKHINAPDNSFKIFSWQLDLGDGTYRQRAAMQFPTADGSLKLLPFFDNSDFTDEPTKGINDRKKWIGAIYYDIILTEHNNQKYYTLLGYDENNLTTSRKIIEVLHFENNEPILGGNYFAYPPDETYPTAPVDRFIITYKKGSNAFIRYEPNQKQIVLSELASTEKNLKVASTLVPSGNEVFFTWKNGKWTMTPTKQLKTTKPTN